MIVVGIDPSISGTSVCSGHHGSTRYDCRHYPSKRLGPHMVHRIRRYEAVIGRIMEDLEPLNPQIVLIEDYSHGSTNRTSEMGEFGGILRWHLTDICQCVEEVAPATMMKFMTGSGKLIAGKSKERIAAALLKDFRVSFDSDDDADAFAYWQLAKAALADPESLESYQLEALNTVFGAKLSEVRAMSRQGEDDVSNNREASETSGAAAF